MTYLVAASKRLAPDQYYRVVIERGGFSLLEQIGLPALFGADLWRPTALTEAWQKLLGTEYARMVSPKTTDEKAKVAAFDFRIKTPAPNATVADMVARFNGLLGTWSHVFSVDDINRSDAGRPEERTGAELGARQAGAGKTPAERAAEDFLKAFAAARKWLIAGGVIVLVGGLLVVAAKFRAQATGARR